MLFRHMFAVWAVVHGDLSFLGWTDLKHSCGVRVLALMENTLEEGTSGAVVLAMGARLQEVAAVQNSTGEVVARLTALELSVLAGEMAATLVALELVVLAGKVVARLDALKLVVLVVEISARLTAPDLVVLAGVGG